MVIYTLKIHSEKKSYQCFHLNTTPQWILYSIAKIARLEKIKQLQILIYEVRKVTSWKNDLHDECEK